MLPTEISSMKSRPYLNNNTCRTRYLHSYNPSPIDYYQIDMTLLFNLIIPTKKSPPFEPRIVFAITTIEYFLDIVYFIFITLRCFNYLISKRAHKYMNQRASEVIHPTPLMILLRRLDHSLKLWLMYLPFHIQWRHAITTHANNDCLPLECIYKDKIEVNYATMIDVNYYLHLNHTQSVQSIIITMSNDCMSPRVATHPVYNKTVCLKTTVCQQVTIVNDDATNQSNIMLNKAQLALVTFWHTVAILSTHCLATIIGVNCCLAFRDMNQSAQPIKSFTNNGLAQPYTANSIIATNDCLTPKIPKLTPLNECYLSDGQGIETQQKAYGYLYGRKWLPTEVSSIRCQLFHGYNCYTDMSQRVISVNSDSFVSVTNYSIILVNLTYSYSINLNYNQSQLTMMTLWHIVVGTIKHCQAIIIVVNYCLTPSYMSAQPTKFTINNGPAYLCTVITVITNNDCLSPLIPTLTFLTECHSSDGQGMETQQKAYGYLYGRKWLPTEVPSIIICQLFHGYSCFTATGQRVTNVNSDGFVTDTFHQIIYIDNLTCGCMVNRLSNQSQLTMMTFWQVAVTIINNCQATIIDVNHCFTLNNNGALPKVVTHPYTANAVVTNNVCLTILTPKLTPLNVCHLSDGQVIETQQKALGYLYGRIWLPTEVISILFSSQLLHDHHELHKH